MEEKPPSAKKVKKEKKKKIKVEAPAEEEVGEQGSPPIQAPCQKLTYIYMYTYTYISMATRSHPTSQCNRSHMQKFVFHSVHTAHYMHVGPEGLIMYNL